MMICPSCKKQEGLIATLREELSKAKAEVKNQREIAGKYEDRYFAEKQRAIDLDKRLVESQAEVRQLQDAVAHHVTVRGDYYDKNVKLEAEVRALREARKDAFIEAREHCRKLRHTTAIRALSVCYQLLERDFDQMATLSQPRVSGEAERCPKCATVYKSPTACHNCLEPRRVQVEDCKHAEWVDLEGFDPVWQKCVRCSISREKK